ncbi:MAG: HDOD domain-containing protein [Gammaproteobacteria bacterium]|nr:HDOD domain-containing protein [Gammaproteobacteria bacterium]
MTQTSTHPEPAVLRRLTTLRELDHEAIEDLSQQIYTHQAKRGDTLLQLGADDDCTLYLLEGSCKLIAEDGKTKVISHEDPSANAPIARLRPSHYRVVAESPVSFLRIDNQLLDQESSFDASSTLSLESYQVDERDDLGHMDAENRLTLQIYEDLNSDRLLLPSLPDVAIRIGEAINDENSDARKVAAVIETDPAISLKIVKAANSARFGGVTQIGTVAEAVARLGMQNTRFLVVTFALRELFRTESRQLSKRMMQLWEHSRRIASLAQVLSVKVGGFNSHEALLAGLVHDIGGIAVIGYARDFPEVAGDPVALESSIRSLRSQLGGMILSRWKLPPELVNVAKESENWFRQHGNAADYTDLVIAAQIHDGVAQGIDPAAVPAIARLGIEQSQIDQGLALLDEAHEEVAAAMRQLTG